MSPQQPSEAFGNNKSADAAMESAAGTSFGVEDIFRWKKHTGRMPEKLEQALGRLKGKEDRKETLTEVGRMKKELLAFLQRNDKPLLEADRERILVQMRCYEDLERLFAEEGAEKILYGAFFREWLGDAGQAEEYAGRYAEREHGIPFAEARMLMENVWRLMRELREDVTPAMRAELAALLSEGGEEELMERHGALLGRKILRLNGESQKTDGELREAWQRFTGLQSELEKLMKRKEGEGREEEMEELSGEVGRLSNELLAMMERHRSLRHVMEEDTAALFLLQDRLLRQGDQRKADIALLKGALALPVGNWSDALGERVAEARSRLRGEGSFEKQFSSAERGILALEKPDDVLRSSLQHLRDASLPLEVRAQLEHASETRAPAFSLEACSPEELVGLKGDRVVRSAAVSPESDRIQGWGAEQKLCRMRKPGGESAIIVRGEGVDARLAQCPSGFTPVLLRVPPSLQFQESGSVQISHRVPGSGHGNVYMSLPIFTIREQPESILSPEDIGFARREIGAGEVISLRRHDGEGRFSRGDFQRAEHAQGEVHTALLHLPAMRAMQDSGREVLARFLPLQKLFETGMMRAGTVLRSGERGWKFQSFVEESRKLANDLYEAYLQSGLMSSYREMKETAAELRSLPKGLMTDAFEEELLAIERQLDAVAALVEGNAIMRLREGILSHSNDPDTYFEYLGGKEFTILMAAIAAGVLAGMAVPTGGASAGVGIFLLRNVLIAAGGHAGSEYMKTWLSATDERIQSDIQGLFQGEMELDEYLTQTLSQIGVGALWSSVLIGVGNHVGRAARQIERGERAANLAQRVMARAITKSSDMLSKVDEAIAGVAPGARGPFATYMREVAEETVEELTENLATSLAANADEAGSEVGAGLLRALGTGLAVLNCAKGKPGNLTGIVRAGDAVTLRYAYDGPMEKLEEALREGGYPTVQPDSGGVLRFEEVVGDGEERTSVVHEFRSSEDAERNKGAIEGVSVSEDHNPFSKHRDAMKQLMDREMRFLPYDPLTEGTIGDLQYRVLFRGGKQQPVCIVSLQFPDGNQREVVLRSARKDSAFVRHHAESGALKECFPAVYLEGDRGGDLKVLILEKISGYDEHSDPAAFRSMIETEDGMKQLVSDMYAAYDRVLSDPSHLGLGDLQPTNGHNVYYDVQSKHFRLFDIDTVKESDESHLYKFIGLLDDLSPGDESKARFRFMMLQRLLREHPLAAENVYSTPKPAYAIIRDINKLNAEAYARLRDRIVEPTSPDWKNAWWNTENESPPSDKTSVRFVRLMKQTVLKIPDALHDACLSNDFERFRELIAQRNGVLADRRQVDVVNESAFSPTEHETKKPAAKIPESMEPSVVLAYMKLHPDLSNDTRLAIAEHGLRAQGILQPNASLSDAQKQAILEAHEYGKGNLEEGYAQGEENVKGLKLMRNNVFTREAAQYIMDAGLAGKPEDERYVTGLLSFMKNQQNLDALSGRRGVAEQQAAISQAEALIGGGYKFKNPVEFFADAQESLRTHNAWGGDDHLARAIAHAEWMKGVSKSTQDHKAIYSQDVYRKSNWRNALLRTERALGGERKKLFINAIVRRLRQRPHLGIENDTALISLLKDFRANIENVPGQVVMKPDNVRISAVGAALEKILNEGITLEFTKEQFGRLPQDLQKGLANAQKVRIELKADGTVMATDSTGKLWAIGDAGCSLLGRAPEASPQTKLVLSAEEQKKYAVLIQEAAKENGSYPSSPTLEQMRVIVASRKGFALSFNMDSITPEMASVLAQTEAGYLGLTLRNVTPEVIQALGKCKKLVELSYDSDHLNQATARAFSSFRGNLWLNKIRTLNPDIAKELALQKGNLSLDGVAIISPEVAEILSQHQGKVYLSNKELHLSPEAARPLARHGDISVSSENKTVLDQTPEGMMLNIKKGWYTYVTGLPSITLEAAKELVEHYPTNTLELHLQNLTPELAKILARFNGDLNLRDIEAISSQVAEELSRHHGTLLLGLKSVDREVASKLSKHNGTLIFDDLESAPDEAVKMFVKRGDKGVLMTDARQNAFDAAFSHGEWKKIAENSDMYSKCMSLYEMPLDLLHELIVAKISRQQGEVSFGVGYLTPEMAKELSAYKGENISLGDLERLSPEAVRELARFQGHLYLSIQSLDGATAKELMAAKGRISLGYVGRLTPDAIETLVRAKYPDLRDLEYRNVDWEGRTQEQGVSNVYDYIHKHGLVDAPAANAETAVPKTNDELPLDEVARGGKPKAEAKLPHGNEELGELILEEPPEVALPPPENIDDFSVGYTVQIAPGHTEGGSIKVGDLMRRVEQGTIPAANARGALIRAHEWLYGEIDNPDMNAKAQAAKRKLQEYIDRLRGK